MLITVVLTLCLQLVKFGEGKDNKETFYDHPQWNWENACMKHPLASTAIPTNNMADTAIGKRCTLTFAYEAVDEDEQDRNEFCKAMFPDKLVESPKVAGGSITCIYRRFQKCNGNDKEYLIGNKCIKMSNTTMNLASSKTACSFGKYSLYSRKNHGTFVTDFLSTLYSFDHPLPYIWSYNAEDDKAAHYYLKYSAIGNYRPGSEVAKSSVEERAEEAMAVCIRDADYLKGATTEYCDMLEKFIKLNTFKKGDTCYHTTVSVMSAKKRSTDPRLATTEHFSKICRVQAKNHNFPVAPRSDEQKSVLLAAYEARKKRGVLLPAQVTVPFDIALLKIEPNTDENGKKQYVQQYSKKELLSSAFEYRIPLMDANNITSDTFDIGAVLPDTQWLHNYPTDATPMGVTKGLLYWSNKKIENVEQYRRAPIVCGAGLPIVSDFICDRDENMAKKWEIAHRSEDTVLCIRVELESCMSWTGAVKECETHGAQMAPMESEAEETAIARAAATKLGDNFFKRDYSSVWLGSNDNNDVHKWTMGGEVVGKKYNRFGSGQPDNYKQCRSTGIFSEECYKEHCLELVFRNGRSIGLNDAVCDDSCRTHTFGLGVACAKMAIKIEN